MEFHLIPLLFKFLVSRIFFSCINPQPVLLISWLLVVLLGEMDPWLLPLKPPEDPDCHGKIVSDSFYKDAVSYLRLTMQSPRYVSLAALHPLVQVKIADS